LATEKSRACCPPPMKALIESCWHHDPAKRPPFERIVEYLLCLERVAKKMGEKRKGGITTSSTEDSFVKDQLCAGTKRFSFLPSFLYVFLSPLLLL
jgi:hypothetical protein